MVKVIEITLLVEVNERMSTRSPNTVKTGGNGPAWSLNYILKFVWAYLTLFDLKK